MTLLRTKLPPALEQTPDRQLLAIQSAARRVAKDSNARMQCVAIEEYADNGSWGNTLTAYAGATFADTAMQLSLATPLYVGDVLIIHGRACVGTDATAIGDFQLVVYEAFKTLTTSKPSTFTQVVANTNSAVFPLSCTHRISVAGMGAIVLQSLKLSGSGNAYTFTRGSIVAEIWRP